jgi:hypothetical protein
VVVVPDVVAEGPAGVEVALLLRVRGLGAERSPEKK